jgi:endo-1,4-beta-xylanase
MFRTIILLLSICSLISVSVCAVIPIGLRATSFLRNILFGTAVSVENIRINIDHGQYIEELKDNYELIVPEYELLEQQLWWGENEYNFSNPDFLFGATPSLIGWAQENQMLMKGNGLLWPMDEHTPSWLLKEESSITPVKAKQLLSDYIHTVVGRYRGKLAWWDVVTEAIDDNNNTNPLNLRDSFWLRKLGPDYIKYAFMFAHEADPNAQLYYNDYSLEAKGLKATRALNLVNWLRSQDVTIHGIGLKWHIDTSTKITPGDDHYQNAQQFIDNKLLLMVTELDVSVPTSGGYPINVQDLETQAELYSSVVEYVLHFSSHITALVTWGFTDRYSQIRYYDNSTHGALLPLDYLYIPKLAYWSLLYSMAHVVEDGIYRLSPQSEPNKCLGISQDATSSEVQLYSGDCNNAYQKWNITWIGGGTYRFSSYTDINRVLSAYNATASVGGVQSSHWSGDFNQEWNFSPGVNNTMRVVVRTAWWRTMTVHGTSNSIVIIDRNETSPENWIVTKV